MAQRHAVLLADQRPVAGLGHLMRCRALAAHLERLGWSCRIAADRSELQSKFDLIVVDDYGADAAFENGLHDHSGIVATFDDFGRRDHAADIVIDSSGADRNADNARQVHNTRQTPVGLRLLEGPSYVPLAKIFFEMRRKCLPRKTRKIERILVAYGSGNIAGLTAVTLDVLKNIKSETLIDIVAAEPAATQLLSSIDRFGSRIRLHRRIENMAPLMAHADLAFGAAGVTAWERCVLGLPSVVVRTADNQLNVAQTLRASQSAVVIDDLRQANVDELGRALTRMFDDGTRMVMSAAAARLCDGLGAARIAAQFELLPISKDGQMITLRMAQDEDCDIIFNWQQDARTRLHTPNPRAPTRNEHTEWFDRTINSADSILQIIMHGRESGGVLRLNRVGHEQWVVSIYTAPIKYGLGLAGAALALARCMFPDATFIAEVLPENKASHALFDAAGYAFDGARYVNLPTPHC